MKRGWGAQREEGDIVGYREREGQREWKQRKTGERHRGRGGRHRDKGDAHGEEGDRQRRKEHTR